MELNDKKETRQELMEKIKFLQEELAKKNKIIEKLREENKTILQTAIKNAQRRIEIDELKKVKEKHS